MTSETLKILKAQLAVPLIEAPVDETRDELKRLWHRLLANAPDPNRGRMQVHGKAAWMPRAQLEG